MKVVQARESAQAKAWGVRGLTRFIPCGLSTGDVGRTRGTWTP